MPSDEESMVAAWTSSCRGDSFDPSDARASLTRFGVDPGASSALPSGLINCIGLIFLEGSGAGSGAGSWGCGVSLIGSLRRSTGGSGLVSSTSSAAAAAAGAGSLGGFLKCSSISGKDIPVSVTILWISRLASSPKSAPSGFPALSHRM